MELLKDIITGVDLHLNVKEGTLEIIYGQSKIVLKFPKNGPIQLNTNLHLETSNQKYIDQT